jgi:hypothetical protein
VREGFMRLKCWLASSALRRGLVMAGGLRHLPWGAKHSECLGTADERGGASRVGDQMEAETSPTMSHFIKGEMKDASGSQSASHRKVSENLNTYPYPFFVTILCSHHRPTHAPAAPSFHSSPAFFQMPDSLARTWPFPSVSTQLPANPTNSQIVPSPRSGGSFTTFTSP